MENAGSYEPLVCDLSYRKLSFALNADSQDSEQEDHSQDCQGASEESVGASEEVCRRRSRGKLVALQFEVGSQEVHIRSWTEMVWNIPGSLRKTPH